MNIVTAGDLHVFSGVELLITSICHYAREPVHFYILSGDIPIQEKQYQSLEKQKDYLTNLVYSYDRGHELTIIDCAKNYQQEFKGFEQNLYGWSPYAILRLLADQLLPEKPFLYLDPDCIVLHDLSDLYTELTNCSSGLLVNSNSDNFCSGVLGCNLLKLNSKNFFYGARTNFRTHIYKYPDQLAIKETDGLREEYNYKYYSNYNPKNINFKEQYIIHCSGEKPLKIYYMLNGCLEQEQEELFWEESKDLKFLHAEILENRTKFNYKFISGEAIITKYVSPIQASRQSKQLLARLKANLKENNNVKSNSQK